MHVINHLLLYLHLMLLLDKPKQNANKFQQQQLNILHENLFKKNVDLIVKYPFEFHFVLYVGLVSLHVLYVLKRVFVSFE